MSAAAREPRPLLRACVWLAALGALFFSSYNFANWVASQRAGVGEITFGWEVHIPFMAWTILPYWTIDALYAASVFLCATRRELDTHGKRLVTVQLLCVSCFLLWPLTFSWPRPHSEGLYGAMFEVLMGFDKPFNQAPSLHIALMVILWVMFARHTRGWLQRFIDVWFIAIGASVLTTYQHHFFDVPTGFAAGWLCVWLWPLDDAAPVTGLTRDAKRRGLALRYAAGGALCGALAVTLGGAWWWLLWPAISLALVAVNYALGGPQGFQKRPEGRLSTAARWLYAPYTVAAFINSRAWTRRAPAPDHVADGVWLGRIPAPSELARGTHGRFAAIVDLCAEIPLRAPHAGGIASYASVPMLDLVTPDHSQLAAAARAIEAARAHGPVLVCCALGYSRSASAVAAWLLHTGRAASARDAVARVRAARPRVVLADAHHAALDQLASGARA